MKLSTTTLWQVLIWLFAVLIFAAHVGVLPDPAKPYVGLAFAALSLALHLHSGTRNPDGTPAALPYAADLPALLSAAEAAYEAYRAQAGGKSLVSGAPIPAFAQLAPAIQDAWKAAAGAAQVSEPVQLPAVGTITLAPRPAQPSEPVKDGAAK